MAITPVEKTVYRCDDGQEFDDEGKALAHEGYLEIEKLLDDKAFNGMSEYEIRDMLIENWKPFLAALRKVESAS